MRRRRNVEACRIKPFDFAQGKPRAYNPPEGERRMATLGGRPMEEWVERYGHSHTHPFNRLCHTLGIPLIALSLPLFVVALVVDGFWKLPLVMFVIGWVLQFAGHAVEGKPPEFFKDWRFLFVGLRWWMTKVGLR
jgi:uncharacterized membrane protein YGL010W